MSLATVEKANFATREEAEADLLRRFQLRLAKAPKAVLFKAVELKDEKAFAEIAKAKVEKERPLEVRNQEAKAQMKARAFERVQERCCLLESSEAYGILGISKQALTQKTQAGLLLAYRNTANRRKYYPEFQFADNKPRPIISKLIAELGVDPADAEAMNILVQHLVSRMDYSSPGEPEKLVRRYELLDDSAAIEIIKRDFKNAFEAGQ